MCQGTHQNPVFRFAIFGFKLDTTSELDGRLVDKPPDAFCLKQFLKKKEKEDEKEEKSIGACFLHLAIRPT